MKEGKNVEQERKVAKPAVLVLEEAREKIIGAINEALNGNVPAIAIQPMLVEIMDMVAEIRKVQYQSALQTYNKQCEEMKQEVELLGQGDSLDKGRKGKNGEI